MYLTGIGMVIWITGITASGKTSLGKALLDSIEKDGMCSVVHLDGDELRQRPGWVQGHSMADRYKVIEKLVPLILEEQAKGSIVIVSTVSHVKQMRDYARERLSNFYEIYLNCSPEICASRDYKGFYSLAEDISDGSDEIFPGVTECYEESKFPELVINTGNEALVESSQKLIEFVSEKMMHMKTTVCADRI